VRPKVKFQPDWDVVVAEPYKAREEINNVGAGCALSVT
jgi:hypothetical protein